MSEQQDVAPNPYSVSPASLAATSVQPAQSLPLAQRWQRLFARKIDLLIANGIAGAVVGFLLPREMTALAGNPIAAFMVGIALLPFALVLDAAIYRVFGNTPGKAIAGLKVLTNDGRKVSFGVYLLRNFKLWFFGLGLSVPLISLFTLMRAFAIAETGQLQPWDKKADTRSYDLAQSNVRHWIIGSLFVLSTLYFAVAQIVSLSAGH